MKQNGFASVLITFLVVILLGVLAWLKFPVLLKTFTHTNGTVVTSNKTPVVLPSPIQNKDWQTYTNTLGAFSFQYPPLLTLKNQMPNSANSFIGYTQSAYFTDNKPFGETLEVNVYPHTGQFSADDYMETYYYGESLIEPFEISLGSLFQASDITPITVDGISGGKIGLVSRAGSGGVGVWLHNGSYGIFIQSNDPKLLDQVLGTFHFTQTLSADQSPELKIHNGDIVVTKNGQDTKLTSYGHNYSPIFSPDKTKIAYLSVASQIVQSKDPANTPEGISNVWIINADGSNPIQVTNYVSNASRDNLFWVDNNRLLFSDGENAVKLFDMSKKLTETIWGNGTLPPGCSSYSSIKQNNGSPMCNFRTDYYFSPGIKYFIAIKSAEYQNLSSTIGIINLSSLNLKTVTFNTPVYLTNFSADGSLMNISKFNYNDIDHSTAETINLGN